MNLGSYLLVTAMFHLRRITAVVMQGCKRRYEKNFRNINLIAVLPVLKTGWCYIIFPITGSVLPATPVSTLPANLLSNDLLPFILTDKSYQL